jgi:hypothetical protein
VTARARLGRRQSTRHPILCVGCALIIPMIIQTIRLEPSGPTVRST